jgi:hypothetical protein
MAFKANQEQFLCTREAPRGELGTQSLLHLKRHQSQFFHGQRSQNLQSLTGAKRREWIQLEGNGGCWDDNIDS